MWRHHHLSAATDYGTPAAMMVRARCGGGHRFPGDVTLRQRYALVGNSLSVDVVAWLLLHAAERRSGPQLEACADT